MITSVDACLFCAFQNKADTASKLHEQVINLAAHSYSICLPHFS
jgi:hypothetical protein